MISYNLRNAQHFLLVDFILTSVEKLFVEGLNNYNDLPLIGKASSNVKLFKEEILAAILTS